MRCTPLFLSISSVRLFTVNDAYTQSNILNQNDSYLEKYKTNRTFLRSLKFQRNQVNANLGVVCCDLKDQKSAFPFYESCHTSISSIQFNCTPSRFFHRINVPEQVFLDPLGGINNRRFQLHGFVRSLKIIYPHAAKCAFPVSITLFTLLFALAN